MNLSLTETVIAGTLKPDGTLELDEKPKLSPGRVQVIVQPLAISSAGLVEVMDEIRISQRARGYQGRSLETAHAEEKARQEQNAEYDQRCESLWPRPMPPIVGRE
jgi:hypothetical protein